MRKIIYTLFVLVGFSSIGFAQERIEIAKSEGKTELLESKVSGEYIFSLPENVTVEEVEQKSSYYTEHFTVDFDAATHKSTLTMVENDVMSRYVVARFLGSCGVRYVEVEGENITIDQLIELYLK